MICEPAPAAASGPRGWAGRLLASDFLRKVGATVVTRVLLVALGLATTIIVARILGPEGRGLYALAVTVGALGVQFGNLGLHASNTWFVARDRGLLPSLAGTSLMVSLLVGGGGALVAWLLFLATPSLAPVGGVLLPLALLWIPFGLAFLLLQNLLLGLQDVRSFNMSELMNRAAAFTLIGALILLGRVSAATVFLAGFAALIITGLWVFHRLGVPAAALILASRERFLAYAHYGMKAYTASFFAYAASRADLFVINSLAGVKEAGIYSVASALTDNVLLIPLVVGSLLFPKLSTMEGHGPKVRFTRRVILLSTLATLGVALVLHLLADPLIRFLFGARYGPASTVLDWLLLGAVFFPAMNAAGQLLGALGNTFWYAAAWAAAALFKVALSYHLVRTYGYAYVGAGNIMVYAMVFIATAILVRRKGRCSGT